MLLLLLRVLLLLLLLLLLRPLPPSSLPPLPTTLQRPVRAGYNPLSGASLPGRPVPADVGRNWRGVDQR